MSKCTIDNGKTRKNIKIILTKRKRDVNIQL